MPNRNYEQLLNKHGMLSAHKDELEKLANSKDGQKVQEFLKHKELSVQKALEEQNTDALMEIMASLAQSEAGKNIISQLSNMMK